MAAVAAAAVTQGASRIVAFVLLNIHLTKYDLDGKRRFNQNKRIINCFTAIESV